MKKAWTMTQHQIDSNGLRAELRALPRGTLLLIAERAIELVTRDQLGALLGDIVQLNVDSTDARSDDAATNVVPSLLDQVRSFHNIAMGGEYYEQVEDNRKGRREQSAGTDAFIAEFDRLMRKCVTSSENTGPNTGDSFAHEVRDCFALLFALLCHIDKGNDDVLAFSDDGSSSDVGVNWGVVMPAYFQCLAKTEASSPGNFARAVNEAISKFSEHDRTRYMDAAHTAANRAHETQ
ncbi:hypothetical protein [Massilia soli]|uniref:Uncharacterized protein n=1 Tax=Massilia soli TaxID=2792854 RepID=A0ABS7SKG0_9BURK|nr:hypothetical protein [Massilia soli]MBZ2206517.1 hypothetical protein [Massilia soli]